MRPPRVGARLNQFAPASGVHGLNKTSNTKNAIEKRRRARTSGMVFSLQKQTKETKKRRSEEAKIVPSLTSFPSVQLQVKSLIDYLFAPGRINRTIPSVTFIS